MQEPPTTVLPPPVSGPPGQPSGGSAPERPSRQRPKLKKLRLAFILAGLGVLALIATVFGMMMAVASDLPELENKAEYKHAKNSIVTAAPTTRGAEPEQLAELTGNNNRILVGSGDISPNIKNAVIAIEDRRFFEHEGVDYKGIGRALWQDLRRQGAVQGGSTITQQFVKNALAAQNKRSVFQKLRESALAYHLEREWPKQKVLTQYLNSVYFGNGAYGVEAAVRTYFGEDQPEQTNATTPGAATGSADVDLDSDDDLDNHAARDATPAEAALLAAMIASPSMYNPAESPTRTKRQRDGVLARMREQGYITEGEYRDALADPLPDAADIDPPQPDSKQPYFTSWLTQQLVDRYKAPAVFSGGLQVTTTLDPELQLAAEQAVDGRLGGVGPSASLVAIENSTGEVKAMVGGNDFETKPFNLATNGHRQPGSAFKPFTLVRALEDGVSPEQTFSSAPKVFPVPNSKTEKFPVSNYADTYAGISSLRAATATSDNSVYAELGLKTGTDRIAALAKRLGVQTKVSTNPAMTLGGLEEGVTPLEMAYAYSTIANGGVRVTGSLASSLGPVAIRRVEGGGREDRNQRREQRVFSRQIGDTTRDLLEGVITSGTGTAAQLNEFAAGKTGTTENYGDAWFVGFNNELTVAVWVGYPDGLKPMETEYRGQPVAGGTYPAEIWRDLMNAWIAMRDRRKAASGDGDPAQIVPTTPTTPVAPTPTPAPEGEVLPTPPQGEEDPETPPETKSPAPQQPERAPAPQRQAPARPPASQGGGAAPG